jgi:hypothetical protein
MNDITQRVRIVRDMYPEMPDDDTQVPVVFLPFMYPTHYNLITAGKEYLPDEGRILEARQQLGWQGAERWLNVFVGPTRRLSSDTNDGYHIAVATPEWREAMGLTDEYMAQLKPPLTIENLLGSWNQPLEIEDYFNGDVFILFPEVLTTWEDSATGRTRAEWETDPEQSAVGGYYGEKWALQMAREDWDFDGPYLVVEEDGTILETVEPAVAS